MNLIQQLLFIAVAALIVYFIPMDAQFKRIAWIIIGIATLLVLLAGLFGITLF